MSGCTETIGAETTTTTTTNTTAAVGGGGGGGEGGSPTAWRLKKGVLAMESKRKDCVAAPVCMVTDEVRDQIIEKFGVTPTVDAFASADNARFERYWSLEDSAWHHDWGKEGLLWINAPCEMYERVLERLIEDRARAIVVCPEWVHLRWYRNLRRYAIDSFRIPRGVRLYRREGKGRRPLKQRRWNTMCFLVDMTKPPAAEEEVPSLI